jgi:mannitol operon transcriptional antiterminator
MLNGEKIEMNDEDLEELRTRPEYSIAEEVARSIQERFQLTVPQAEIGFITMHLSSARVMPQSRRFQRQLRTVNTHQVVMSIVNSVEQELDLPFHTCTRMIEELTSHMDSMISRLSMNIHLDNTQVEEIQQNYPHIYAAVERACQVFKTSLRIQDVSPSEITFVAMHFVAAAETMQVERTRVSVAVVCPSGMGASRMLAANLMRSFHNIEVRQIVSAFSIRPEKLRSDGIDLVISTVPLNIDFPVVCVNPIPQAQDVMLITQTVGRIRKMRKGDVLPNQPQIVGRSPVTVASIEKMTRIGEEILEILSHFAWHALSSVQRTEELMGEAAGLFADSLLTRRIISNDLAQRESVASTYLPTMGIHLLHCRTSATEHCRFGFLKLEHPISTPLGNVEGAVLLLSPQSGSDECVEVVSRLSMLLAEEERFLQALLSGDIRGAKALAEQALVKYYEQTMKRIGDGTV